MIDKLTNTEHIDIGFIMRNCSVVAVRVVPSSLCCVGCSYLIVVLCLGPNIGSEYSADVPFNLLKNH